MRYQVVVVGGGTAGVPAAIAASRLGAKTLIIEAQNSLGGTQANGWVTPMMPNYLGSHKLSRGISREITKLQSEVQDPGKMEHGDVWYDPTYLAVVMDELVAKSGASVLFGASLLDVQKEARKVQSIDVLTVSGVERIDADCFIDCTGDAALSFVAGAETMSGNEDGENQPMTLRFTLGNVDLRRVLQEERELLRIADWPYLECGYGEAKDGALGPRIREAVTNGVLDEDDLGYFQFFTVNGRPGELAINAPRLSGFKRFDSFSMSQAYALGRKKIFRIANFCRSYLRGFEDCYVSAVAPMMGIRESRRVVGDYVLTGEDHQAFQKFEDVIARNRYPVDIHLKKGLDYRKYPDGEFHDIPYRSLVVKGFDNLWVAGRCASADFVAQSAIRIQPVCRAMGEAAGVGAALSAISRVSSRDVPIGQIQRHLDLSLPS